MDELLRAERDAIVTLGLLARTHFLFDHPIPQKAGDAPTHFAGLNVHCCVVDNTDGEVVAFGRNTIHSDENPLQHAEQVAVRAAHERLRRKRPRAAGVSVEDYYRTALFMAKGSRPADFVRVGCTLYNAFDPCAMCAATLLIAYMKRIAYVISDVKYEGFYEETKRKYFPTRESTRESVKFDGTDSVFVKGVRQLHADLLKRVEELLAKHVDLINALDQSADILARAAGLLQKATVGDLTTKGDDLARNSRTLTDVKRACNLPSAG
jgi:tRNA(Arg) A34 adenosine deaminase TadA